MNEANRVSVQITTPTSREVVVSRVFHAPRDKVFDALTKPELLRRWYGPPGWTLVVCEVDLLVDGMWRFVLHKPNGMVVGQRGVYREIVPAEKLVNTETWEDWDAGETVVTTRLVENAGRTTFTSTILFPSEEVRDTVVKSGLESGVSELYDKLDGLLAAI